MAMRSTTHFVILAISVIYLISSIRSIKMYYYGSTSKQSICTVNIKSDCTYNTINGYIYSLKSVTNNRKEYWI